MMKKFLGLFLGLYIVTMAVAPGRAQNYSIDWYKIAGGGGTSAGGNFQLSGTIGQADAGSTMSGGSYSLTGGFWSMIATVASPGVPNLTITWIGTSTVKISWLNSGTYTLQSNNNLASGAWSSFSGTVTTAAGTNSVTITPPAGSLFFRLKQ